MFFKKQVITLLCYILYLSSYSQINKVSYSNQFWYQYYNQLQLNEKWNINSDIGIRYKSNHSTINQTLARIGVQYKLNKITTVSLGFANFNGYSKNKLNTPEMRIWQEISIKHSIYNLQIHHRIRSEERFFTYLPDKNKLNTLRLRYRLYCTYPLNHKTIENKTIYLIAGDEFFVSGWKTNQTTIISTQNRILAGIGFKLNNQLNFTATFVNQLNQKNNLNMYDEANIIWIGIIHSIQLKPKKIQQ